MAATPRRMAGVRFERTRVAQRMRLRAHNRTPTGAPGALRPGSLPRGGHMLRRATLRAPTQPARR
eukprot:5809917-Prymnesium_polylepis.1